jgi:hypothetical protein
VYFGVRLGSHERRRSDVSVGTAAQFEVLCRGIRRNHRWWPGIMEAANRGASECGGTSIGLGIELPKEQGLNDWVDLGINFRYFFVRKTMFIKYSQGVCGVPRRVRYL